MRRKGRRRRTRDDDFGDEAVLSKFQIDRHTSLQESLKKK